ncbi:MAG: hypothetical protein R6V17_04725 [Halanaerobacter sp.]
MATDFNTSGLADYTAANPQKALELMILTGKGTKDYFDIETGVKYQTKIPYISNVDVDISTGAISGYNTGSGQTTIEEITLSNDQLKLFETYTKEQLRKTIMALVETRGTDPAELPIEDMILALKQKEFFVTNEKYLWQDEASMLTDGGILYQIDDASDFNSTGVAAVSFQTLTDASILEAVNAVNSTLETDMPEYINEEMILAMSPANFAAYSRALYNLNGTVTTDTIGANGKPIQEVYIPGTNVKAVSMIGLTGKNDLVCTHKMNIIQVVDLVDETDFLSFQYNPFARWHELAGQYKLGVKVADTTKVIAAIS